MSRLRGVALLDSLVNREQRPSIAAGRTDDLTLEPMRRLMAALGDPQHSYGVIHITGTNGKGSVAATATAMLEAMGLTVGTYTSPHLQRVNERLRWTGGAIADDELDRVIDEVMAVADTVGVTPSYFELLTASAFAWFAELPVDVAVVEVGLLGEFDATNVVDADVAVITNVGPDHTDFAPGWREAIAKEKAGIVKPGSVLVLGATDDDLRAIFAERPAAAMVVLDEDLAPGEVRDAVGGKVFDLHTPAGTLEELFVPLHGAHQVANVALAVGAVEAFVARELDEELARTALAEVTVPGRFEVVRRSPLVVLDAAHNPSGAASLAETLDAEFDVAGRTVLVLGLLGGRDPEAFLDALELTRADLVLTVTPDSPRAIAAGDLAALIAARGVAVEAVGEVADALARAAAVTGEDDLVVVTGSVYVVGAARDALGLRPPGT